MSVLGIGIIDYKLDRQIQRIKDESEPETAELPEVDTEGDAVGRDQNSEKR